MDATLRPLYRLHVRRRNTPSRARGGWVVSCSHPTDARALGPAAMRAMGILTPLDHKEKPWIKNITTRLRERNIGFELVDPSTCFDPDDDERLKGLSLL
eukprot:3238922-Pyramimonas_sp.AAC.1